MTDMSDKDKLMLARKAVVRFGVSVGWCEEYKRQVLRGLYDHSGHVQSALFAIKATLGEKVL